LKVKLIQVNKTSSGWLNDGVMEYIKRLSNYIPLEIKDIEIQLSKAKTKDLQLQMECDKIMMLIKPADFVVLLDDKGKMFTSEEMAEWLNKKFSGLSSDLIFVIGGAYGFHEILKKRANEKISLSKMTFTHQMVRVIFLEQLYRALTILKNEPYHHS
jgi:23S rRNA (pseudouridine1915-N3)-methyltransferase